MTQPAWKIRSYLGWIVQMSPHVGVPLGILLSILLGSLLAVNRRADDANQQSSSLVSPASHAPNPELIARPHLIWATEKCLTETEQPLKQVRAVFAKARSQSRAFAEEALGFDSKLTLISDYFQHRENHRALLRERFERLVVSEAELLLALEQSVSQFQRVTSSIEGEMLVRLRSDAGDFRNSPLMVTSDVAALQSLFQRIVTDSGTAAGVDLQAAIGRELASYVLGEIATQVALKLGVSSGILSVGAASGWSSFGISIAVGFAVDQIVAAAYDAYADPKGQLTSQINAQLDEMERMIIDGTSEHLGLRSLLRQFARERSAIRESAVLQLLTTGQGVPL